MRTGIKMNRSCICLVGLVMIFAAAGCRSVEKQPAAPQPQGYEQWQASTEAPVGQAPGAGGADVAATAGAVAAQDIRPVAGDSKAQTQKTAPVTQNAPARPGVLSGEIQSGSVPPVSESAAVPVRALPDMPVSMKMHEVPVSVLLRTLARAADINMMINESVTGNANINISNVPWNQAFEGLLDTYGLAYKWSGDVLRIITVEDLNREIALMEATQKFERSKKEHTIAMLNIQQKQEELDPLVTEIIKVDYANLEMLRANLENYLLAGKKDFELTQAESGGATAPPTGKTELRGSILMDPGSSTLIIQATRSDLEKIKPIIWRLDQPTQQILIETHIVEANSDTAKELGIQWGGLGLNSSGDRNNWIGGPVGTFDKSLFVTSEDATEDMPAGTPIVYQPSIGTGINFPSSGDALTDPNWMGMTLGLMTQKIGSHLLYAQLTALEKEGKLEIRSRPSITTMDHRKAIIESGQEVPFQTVVDNEVNIEFKKAVIKLEVTPHVIDDNSIRLEIITSKDELDFTRTVLGNPVIITKNAQTEVYLLDGQTTVIGGLKKDKILQSQAGIPFLKDIPGLGRLFRNDAGSQEYEELLIFLTPNILHRSRADAAE
jgi:type IV pilus assembly protein PilQ